MSRREFNEHNLAPIRLDQFPPDHLVDRIVGALDQNLGADAANEFNGRILLENDDRVDGFEG